jgi:hypothetical protein
MIAFGDAENDIPLLIEAEVGVAARGAVPAVLSVTDDSVSQPGGAGVALYIRKIIEREAIIATPRRRAVILGKTTEGAETTLPCSGTNILISGDPRSGKSWIAGLFAERLITAGYQLCIIDPEGDYAQLGERSKVVTFGGDLVLPTPQAASRFLTNTPLSIILTLSSLAPADQMNYMIELLSSVQALRNTTGLPHWVLIDEAHYFFRSESPCLKYLNSPSGGFCLVTYRPSLLASEVYDTIGAHVTTSTKVEEERYFVTKILQARGPRELVPHEALERIEPPGAGLLLANTLGATWQVFTPAERITCHAHHARKYADTRLPDNRAFYFVNAGRPAVAHNMVEFYQALRVVPLASIRHHLNAGDFSRWVAEVLGDQQLAS